MGIRDDGRVQVDGEGLTGRVVVIGQQLVDDGSPITIRIGCRKQRPPAATGAGAQ